MTDRATGAAPTGKRPTAREVAGDLLGLVPARPGTDRESTFGVVTAGGRPRFLLPLATPAATQASCLAYLGLRDRPTRIQRRAVAAAFRAGAGQAVAPERLTADTGSGSLLAFLADLLGRPGLPIVVAMGLGSVDTVWKPTLQAFDTDGTPLAFVKVGLGPVAAALVEREAEALAAWAAHPDPRLVVPDLLGVGRWNDVALVAVAPLPPDARRLPGPVASWPVGTLDPPVADGPLEGSPWWAAQVAKASAATAAHRAVLDTVAERHGGMDRAWARWHGDWVRWNLARSHRGLVAWDWEYSEPAAPSGLDDVHGRYQQARVVEARPVADALAAARAASPSAWLADAHVAMLVARDAELATLAGTEPDHQAELLAAANSAAGGPAMTDTALVGAATTGAGEGAATSTSVGAVARGGALNLAGSVVYGAANFGLLVVLNRTLGARSAGVVLVAIAIFNISSAVAELGCSTGLIRTMSQDRALGRADRLRATLVIATVPVAVVGVALAGGLFLAAAPFARVLADGAQVEVVTDVLRAMAVFLPFSALHSVVVAGTRGFDTMRPQVVIERIGRAVTLPLVVAVAVAAGMGPVGVAVAWAATNVVALVFSGRAMVGRVRAATEADGREPRRADAAQARRYWAFTAPRAVGQTSEKAVNWIDTVIVGAMVSTTAGGIYASGTRYLLPGLYAAEALMQVTGPRISGLLARGERGEATALLKVVAGWQTAVMWPLYLLTALFPTPLLRVFGADVVQARGALIALAVAMLVTAPAGPVASVILMSGRSRQAMANTLVLVAVNLGGNLLLVPHLGITGAGLVWAATIGVAALLPGWQAARSLGISTLGRPALVAVVHSAATVGVVALAARFLLGDSLTGLAVAGSLGALAYLAGLRFVRAPLHLEALWDGIRRRS